MADTHHTQAIRPPSQEAVGDPLEKDSAAQATDNAADVHDIEHQEVEDDDDDDDDDDDGINEASRENLEPATNNNRLPFHLSNDDEEADFATSIANIGKEVTILLKQLHITLSRMKIAALEAGADDPITHATERREVQEAHAGAYDMQLTAVQHEEPVRRVGRLWGFLERMWGEKEALRMKALGVGAEER
ncbi:hypothetical protein LTR36_003832 [Oleoguttula mirabilis]|uniref:Uncharacterized protein n=1 Tax=Oleoguttula mirabilis TaxID=1507867 RepID=A0AAV9JHP9_9PEZI|nr:hypothetical protein LTR36_003832 [Oleoguttula mirabilis]